jgi:hypothetical protein
LIRRVQWLASPVAAASLPQEIRLQTMYGWQRGRAQVNPRHRAWAAVSSAQCGADCTRFDAITMGGAAATAATAFGMNPRDAALGVSISGCACAEVSLRHRKSALVRPEARLQNEMAALLGSHFLLNQMKLIRCCTTARPLAFPRQRGDRRVCRRRGRLR